MNGNVWIGVRNEGKVAFTEFDRHQTMDGMGVLCLLCVEFNCLAWGVMGTGEICLQMVRGR